ncbi:FecR domain-containing protein [Thalassospira sp. NFXS8]|uniref:FecR family protein n=1 Tax=Thalassospira sp. NFXS8 TaxID=2819093 RepID=UPI0032E03332
MMFRMSTPAKSMSLFLAPFRPAPLTLAALAMGTIIASSPAYARGEQAGVSAAVRGDVELAEAKGIVGTQVESGQPIYLGDYITSSPGSGMQILLMDETVFTIGPNSEIAIDDFVYDPANNQGHMSASITRGVVRVLTGKLAHNDPKTMKINLPVGSIGIRGTQFLVSVQDGPGDGNGTGGSNSWSPSTQQFARQQLGSTTTTGPIVGVVNLGPGAGRNDSGSRPGAVELTSLNGVTQPLSSEGFGAFITGDTVTPPTRFPADLAGLDMSTLVTRPSPRDAKQNGRGNTNSNGNGNGNSNSSTSGQQSSTTASTSGSSGTSGSGGTTPSSAGNSQTSTLSGNTMAAANNQTGQTVASVLDVAMTQTSVTTQTSETSNQTAEQNSDVHSDPDITTDIPGETVDATTFKIMSEISNGIYNGYLDVSTSNLSYRSFTEVDFGSRHIFTEIFNIVDSTGSEGYISASKYYTDRSDYAIITSDDFQFDPGSACDDMGCKGKVTFTTPTAVNVELTTNAVPEGASGSYGLNEYDKDPGNAPDLDPPVSQDP